MRLSSTNRRGKESGMALIIAVLSLMTLSALAAAIVLLSQTEIWTSSNYRNLAQARYVAEAGAQQAANWLAHTYAAPASWSTVNTSSSFPVTDNGSPPKAIALTADGTTGNYPPDSTVQTAFNTALNGQSVPGVSNSAYQVKAALLSLNTSSTPPLMLWEITSTGTIDNKVRKAQVQVVERIERPMGNSIPMFAAYATYTGCSALSFAGAVTTDSFNSANGSYAATHTNSNANLGASGSLNAAGSVTVHGQFDSLLPASSGACPSHSYNYAGSATIDNGAVQLTTAPNYPTPALPSGPTSASESVGAGSPSCAAFPAGTCTASGGNITLAPGNYNALSGAGSGNIYLNAGTYNIYSISFAGSYQLVVNSGPVIINFAAPSNPVSAAGSWFSNPGGAPTNLRINYGGTGSISVAGSSGQYAFIDAPLATVSMAGGMDWYGSVVAYKISGAGGVNFHYDQALGNTFSAPSAYQVTQFRWNKY